MRKLIASLSLALITGINAETSDNLVQDPYVDFLDSTYDYPNIHNHGTWVQDPYIYTGNSNYEHSATADYSINLDTLTYEITKVNYGYSYKAYYDGLGAIGLALLDADGNMIDSTTYEFDITASNTLTDVDRVYNQMDNLSQANTIRLGVGGISDRNGTDDIMITDIYLNYEYQEIPLDIITDTSISLALDNTYTTLPTHSYDFPAVEMPTTTPEVQAPAPQPVAPTPAPTPTPSPAPVAAPQTQSVKAQPKQTQKTQSVKKETKEVKKNETKAASTTKGINEYRIATSVENITGPSMGTGMGNGIGFGNTDTFFGSTGVDMASFTGVDLVELIQLTEPTFYDEPDFYEQEINLTDNIQLDNIDFYKGTNWYGSNIKFY